MDLPTASPQTAGAGGDAGIESAGPTASIESGSSSEGTSSPGQLPDGVFQNTILAAVGTYGIDQSLIQESYSSNQISDYSSVSPSVVEGHWLQDPVRDGTQLPHVLRDVELQLHDLSQPEHILIHKCHSTFHSRLVTLGQTFTAII